MLYIYYSGILYSYIILVYYTCILYLRIIFAYYSRILNLYINLYFKRIYLINQHSIRSLDPRFCFHMPFTQSFNIL